MMALISIYVLSPDTSLHCDTINMGLVHQMESFCWYLFCLPERNDQAEFIPRWLIKYQDTVNVTQSSECSSIPVITGPM